MKTKFFVWLRIVAGLSIILGSLIGPGLANLATDGWRALAESFPGSVQYNCTEGWANVNRQNDGITPINWTGKLSFDGNEVGTGSGTLEPGGWANVGANLPADFKGIITGEINFEGVGVFSDSKDVNCIPPPIATDTIEPTDTPEPTLTETPVCTIQGLTLHGKVNIVNDDNAAVQASAEWQSGPDSIQVDFWGQGTRDYTRGSPPIPPDPGWEVTRQGEDYQLTLISKAYENGELCAEQSIKVTIPKRICLPTNTPTATEVPTKTLEPTKTTEPTKTVIPTETTMPTATQPAQCIVTDLKGRLTYTGNHFGGNPVTGFVTNLSNDPQCQDKLFLLAFGSDLEPESNGWLESQHFVKKWTINVPPGTVDKSFSQNIDTSKYCWYQVDLLRTSEVRVPPYYSGNDMIDYVFVEGNCNKPTPTATSTQVNTPTATKTGQPSSTATPQPRPQGGASGPIFTWQIPTYFVGFFLLIWGIAGLFRRKLVH